MKKNDSNREARLSRLKELQDSIREEKDPEGPEDLLTEDDKKPVLPEAPPRPPQADPRQSVAYLEHVRQAETPEARARLAREMENYFYEWPVPAEEGP